MVTEALSLADLETFDQYATARGTERRFCCPLQGCSEKSINRSHQSLTVNTETGAWQCHRCGSAGKLRDFWTERPKPDRNRRNRAKLDRAFGLRKESTAAEEPSSPSKSLQSRLKELKPLPGSPAEAYLIGRGIPAEFIPSLRVLFAGAWKHWEPREDGRLRLTGADRRVVFPVYHWNGSNRTLVAISARAIDPAFIETKVQTIGEKKHGIFATEGALDGDVIVITEAPIDALSLAACGLPAIALLGTTWPDWLLARCAFRTVLLATDNDDAGNAAAEKLAAELGSYGANCKRLRPSRKDWNEDLIETGPKAMKAALCAFLERIGIEPVLSLEHTTLPATDLAAAADEPASILDAYPEDSAELLTLLAESLSPPVTESAERVLADLQSQGYRFRLAEDGRLRVGTPDGAPIAAEITTRLRPHRERLVELLRTAGAEPPIAEDGSAPTPPLEYPAAATDDPPASADRAPEPESWVDSLLALPAGELLNLLQRWGATVIPHEAPQHCSILLRGVDRALQFDLNRLIIARWWELEAAIRENADRYPAAPSD